LSPRISTLDRYVIRETLVPFVLVLLGLTFVLEIPVIIDQGEKLIAKGASFAVISQVLLLLVPQALGITIPMSLLIGLLMALGRLSADREVVALQACGVSLVRLLRPIGALAGAACAATLYVMIVAVPDANQAFRELTYRVVSSWTQGEIRPHVFFQDFPGMVVYVGDASPEGGWNDVFVADTNQAESPRIYTARHGEIRVDGVKRTVQMVLAEGQTHFIDRQTPEQYEATQFGLVVLTLDPAVIFKSETILKGEAEKTIAELRQDMRDMGRDEQACVAGGQQSPERCATMYSTHNQQIHIHQKFSIPIACLVFGLMALPLGVSTRKEGKLGSFVLGGAVVCLYYFVMSISGSLAKGHQVSPTVAAWLPNIVLGLLGSALFMRRLGSAGRPIRIPLPFRFGRQNPPTLEPPVGEPGMAAATNGNGKIVLILRVPDFSLPGPTILDRYVMRTSARAIFVAGGILLGLFYIATFLDLSDKLFKGQATGRMILTLLWFSTPQYLYYVIPLAVLIGTLVTIGTITRNSELVVMKACGISLYRVAAPLLMLAVVGSGFLFVLEERVLAVSNRRAEVVNNVVRGRAPRSSNVLNRRWLAGRDNRIYHYVYFDRDTNALHSFSVYDLDRERRTVAAVTFAAQATHGVPKAGRTAAWEARNGWVRRIVPKPRFEKFDTRGIDLESPQYFASEEPDAELMSYSELRDYVSALQAGGFNVVPYVVSLHRKVAFPFVTLVMTLIAVPFAVTMGRSGGLYGIGAGVVLAIVYWIVISVFAAIGSAGLIAPLLAAWAPNILFTTFALYLVLTVRT
jgi:LPS export ABC transporter permease LptG/LPS export ABC transporter permease LptF